MNPTPNRWQVPAEVARAETLDKAFYLDPALQPLQRERIFARSWQWLGDDDGGVGQGAHLNTGRGRL